MIGQTISHYKILEQLGGGGMGVVYKAEDTKLKRHVALKFLPPELTRDPESKERFIHEAQAASALDHPNICTIYEVGETDDGQLFIAMACYEGETLKQRIDQRPLKLEQATDFATQIANGLAKAHEAGIVHRDIKPANIVITDNDEVKILDFGLAKLSGQTKLTKLGTTIGTASYMSPEQMRAEKVDHRTDIWSLGVVMYEMITGQLPFKGDYEQAVTYAILNDEPEPITALRTGVPMALEGIVMKVMAKDPKQRYQHVDEIPVDLQAIELALTSTSQISRTVVSKSVKQQPLAIQEKIPWRIVAPLFAVAAILIFLAGWFFRPHFELEPKSVSMFTHSLSLGETLRGNRLAISPDGTMVVYGVTTESVTKLYLRKIDQLKPTPLDNTENAFRPFFSPDGRDLCFFANNKLKKVSIDGGPAQTICDVSTTPYGGTWGDDGTIIFASYGWGLSRVPASGGISKMILSPDSGKISGLYRFPEMLPGSKSVLFTAWEGISHEEANVAVYSLETGESKTLIIGGTRPLYSSTGHILFGRSNSYWAVEFDAKRLKITGPEVPVQEGVMIYAGGTISIVGDTEFRGSTNGTVVYIPDVIWEGERTLVVVDRQGVETLLTDKHRTYHSPRFSPDGTQVAIEIFEESTYNIWIHDIDRAIQTQLTSGGSSNRRPCWTPDGQKVTFQSSRSGVYNIFWKRADSVGEAERLFPSVNTQPGGTWSDDGTLLAFYEIHPTTQRDIWVYRTGDSTASPFLTQPYNESSPAISPDGNAIAYTSNRTGRSEVYITPYPGPGRDEPVSTQGGRQPVWAPDGRELFYWEGDKMMVVSLETQPSLELGIPELLFEKHYAGRVGRIPAYDIHPDGKRFLMLKSVEDQLEPSYFNIVLNWHEVLKEKMTLAQE